MGISRIFDISRRSLSVYQQALDVTAHNIANASNTDYSRQRATIVSGTPEKNAGFLWGTGVKITDITRARDTMIEKQLNNYYQKFSDADRQSTILSQVEQIFAEPGELGLSNLMSQFFVSWQELSVTPNSLPLRNKVINTSQNLSTKVKEIYGDLEVIRTDIISEFKKKTELLNTSLENIRVLNQKIYEAKSIGENPNDLMDQRDKAINDLSKMVNIQVSYDQNNTAMISIGGIFAADSTFATKFGISGVNGKLSLVTEDGGKSANLSSGELNALSEIYNNKIPNYSNEIDNIINQLLQSVNGIHSTGYTITSPNQTGVNFFDSYKDGILKINEDILNDPKMIAISADGSIGNAELAIKLGNLAEAKIFSGSTFVEKYTSLISKIGNDKQSNSHTAESNKLVLDQLENQRSSYSGVSVDEEMTNVIKFQRSYDASAKLIKVADEMLQTILNMV